jgi:hypothetical protein
MSITTFYCNILLYMYQHMTTEIVDYFLLLFYTFHRGGVSVFFLRLQLANEHWDVLADGAIFRLKLFAENCRLRSLISFSKLRVIPLSRW